MTSVHGQVDMTGGNSIGISVGTWRGFMLVALVLGVAWINLSRVPNAEGNGDQSIEAPMIGFLAPEFSLESTAGELITLSSLRGQPVVINFWATWCPPCRAEMPDLERIWVEEKPEGLVVLGVNQGERMDTVVRYARDEVGVSFPLLLDSNQEVGNRYGVRAFPTTYFVDAEGRIQDIKIGGPLDMATLTASTAKLVQN